MSLELGMGQGNQFPWRSGWGLEKGEEAELTLQVWQLYEGAAKEFLVLMSIALLTRIWKFC